MTTQTQRKSEHVQQQHLLNLIDRYTQRTAKSKHYAQTYRTILADKSSLGLVFSPALKELCYPVVAHRSAAARLWDIDGNEYVDILMGLGINLFGHNPPFIRDAIQTQLEMGIQIAPQSELAGEVAQLICDLTGAERVTFSNTGTEAIMTAIRLARTATNRNKIAVFTNSYHGHCDHTLVRATLGEYAKKAVNRNLNQRIHPNSWLNSFFRPFQSLLNNPNPKAVVAAPGIPEQVAENVLVLDYDNPRSLDIIQSHRKDLAAVLVEPVQSRCPELQPREFLQELRIVTATHNIALIFDEMVTGFRISQGGAQTWFGIEADLVTYSKIIGGGLPLSVIAGKAAYLDRIDGGSWNYGDRSAPSVKPTFFAGTFCKHPLALAAAKAVLLHLKNHESLHADLNQRTAQLVERLNAAFLKEAIALKFTHFGSFFAVDRSQSALTPMALDLMSYHLLLRGIHLRPGDKGGFLSTAHTDSDIDQIFQAFQDSIYDLREGDYL
ncbi:MAG: aminotransferase class III-fold pyridoxal phosphate-dependent enzyme [Leptolyngbyaceae cyanobacterium CSU_1_4]|nr:aminotransferase class III-fold pyridoxal phosphate-dependent enzyme [Leptolyngbyaceae cyanobacterium CSU_1_4]